MPNSTGSSRSATSRDAVTNYARRVVAGEVPAGRWHRLACDRHLRDLADSDAGRLPFVYRPRLARRAFDLFRLYRHYKGSEWAGRPVRLAAWQMFIVGSLMGWIHVDTRLRRFRNAFVELPRGNGKSTLAGGLLVMFAFFLRESGAEAYSVATKKDQARISFQAGRQMVLRSPALKKYIQIGKYTLYDPATESKMEPLGSDADTLDGLRPFLVVVDEVHKLPNADLIDVMESGQGTRLEPLLFGITTAGHDDQSVYGQYSRLSTQILDRTIALDEWFAFIAAADPDDDWTKPATWAKANPNYGTSVKVAFLDKECRKALANPAEQPKFRRLYLGQKLDAAESYFSSDDWRACPDLPADVDLRSCPCYLGLDLSNSVDVTAAVLVWKLPTDDLAVRPIFWLPGDNLSERSHRDRLPYDRWSRDTLAGRADPIVRLTDGNVIDFPRVRRDVVELVREWNVALVCADPWQMRELGPALQADHVHVILVPQSFALLSHPMKTLQAAILKRAVRHDHNPLMSIMVASVVPRTDDKANVLPSKKKSRGKIDGVAATLNAMSQLPVARPIAFEPFFLGGTS